LSYDQRQLSKNNFAQLLYRLFEIMDAPNPQEIPDKFSTFLPTLERFYSFEKDKVNQAGDSVSIVYHTSHALLLILGQKTEYLAKLAELRGQSSEEVILDLLIHDPGNVLSIDQLLINRLDYQKLDNPELLSTYIDKYYLDCADPSRDQEETQLLAKWVGQSPKLASLFVEKLNQAPLEKNIKWKVYFKVLGHRIKNYAQPLLDFNQSFKAYETPLQADATSKKIQEALKTREKQPAYTQEETLYKRDKLSALTRTFLENPTDPDRLWQVANHDESSGKTLKSFKNYPSHYQPKELAELSQLVDKMNTFLSVPLEEIVWDGRINDNHVNEQITKLFIPLVNPARQDQAIPFDYAKVFIARHLGGQLLGQKASMLYDGTGFKDIFDMLKQDHSISQEWLFELFDASNYVSGSPDSFSMPNKDPELFFTNAAVIYISHSEKYLGYLNSDKVPQKMKDLGKLMWCFLREKVFEGQVFSSYDPYAGEHYLDLLAQFKTKYQGETFINNRLYTRP
ncbi:MAG: hypothetical protein KDK66_02405, partial [Deltaproteobacteria bacterium]|nr:hypothetical protein [Deltaproteobacteria bacterium]